MKLSLITVLHEYKNPLQDFEDSNNINQEELEKYLRKHKGDEITIRYRSLKPRSDREWRHVKVDDYDDTYIYSRHEDDYMIRYRRARVVEYK
jgi:hypothetical protein